MIFVNILQQTIPYDGRMAIAVADIKYFDQFVSLFIYLPVHLFLFFLGRHRVQLTHTYIYAHVYICAKNVQSNTTHTKVNKTRSTKWHLTSSIYLNIHPHTDTHTHIYHIYIYINMYLHIRIYTQQCGKPSAINHRLPLSLSMNAYSIILYGDPFF